VNPDVVIYLLQPEIAEKHSEKRRKKQQPTENQKILNTEISAKWWPVFYI